MLLHNCVCVHVGVWLNLCVHWRQVFLKHRLPLFWNSLTIGLKSRNLTRLTGQWDTGIHPLLPPEGRGLQYCATIPGFFLFLSCGGLTQVLSYQHFSNWSIPPSPQVRRFILDVLCNTSYILFLWLKTTAESDSWMKEYILAYGSRWRIQNGERDMAVSIERWQITSSPHAEIKGKQEVGQGYRLESPPRPVTYFLQEGSNSKRFHSPNSATYRGNKCPHSWACGGHFSLKELHLCDNILPISTFTDINTMSREGCLAFLYFPIFNLFLSLKTFHILYLFLYYDVGSSLIVY